MWNKVFFFVEGSFVIGGIDFENSSSTRALEQVA